MKTVTIISIWTKRDQRDPAFTYTVNVPEALDASGTLERAFALTNRDDRPNGNRCCATSAGDIMVLDGQAYLVEGVGYHAITPQESEAFQRLTSRDTSFGYKWCVDHQLIPTL